MLGQAHAVDRQHILGGGVGAGEVLDGGAGQPRDGFDLVPARRAAIVGEGLEAMGVLGDEVVIQNAAAVLRRRRRLDGESGVVLGLGQQGFAVRGVGLALGGGFVVGLDERLADAREQGDVATVADLQDI